MVVHNGRVEMIFVEEGKEDNFAGDPFSVSDATSMLEYLTNVKDLRRSQLKIQEEELQKMKKLTILLQSESGNKTESIDFDLYDLPIVDRFVELLEYTKSTSFVEGRIDVRRSNTEESTLSLASEMNDVIDKVNPNEGCSITDDLKLDLEVEPTSKLKNLTSYTKYSTSTQKNMV